MGSRSLKTIKQKRDGGGGAVAVLPHVLLNSPAFKSLSGNAVRLLIDMTMQYNCNNNGQLLCSFRHMSENRGWKSNDLLKKALTELIDRDLVVKTVQGRRPNLASWFGLTWLALDEHSKLEISTKNWPRGAYARWCPPTDLKPRRVTPSAEIQAAATERKKALKKMISDGRVPA